MTSVTMLCTFFITSMFDPQRRENTRGLIEIPSPADAAVSGVTRWGEENTLVQKISFGRYRIRPFGHIRTRSKVLGASCMGKISRAAPQSDWRSGPQQPLRQMPWVSHRKEKSR